MRGLRRTTGITLLMVGQVFAGDMGHLYAPPSLSLIKNHFFTGRFYLGGTVGSSWGRAGDNQPSITYYNNLLTDAYPIDHRTSGTSILGLHAGYEFAGANRIPTIALGIGAYTIPSWYHYSDHVTETALGGSPSSLYTNRFRIKTSRVMAEATFIGHLGQSILPFIDIGIGSAWNSVGNYTETVATPNGYVPLAGFKYRTTSHFAYQVGGGLGYSFNLTTKKGACKHERLSVGYRFADLGDANFGIRNASYPYALNTGTLHSQDIYLTFTHLF